MLDDFLSYVSIAFYQFISLTLILTLRIICNIIYDSFLSKYGLIYQEVTSSSHDKTTSE